MSVKAEEPLCCSQACWAVSDFNTNHSSPQHSEGCSAVSSRHARSLGVSGSSVVCAESLSLTHQGSSSRSLVFRNATKATGQQEPMLGGWARKLELQHLDLGQKHQGEKMNPPHELLRPYVAVSSRMFVFHLLHGTAHPAAVSLLEAVLGLLFRTDSEEMVPLNGGTQSTVNHCVTSPGLGVFLGDLRAHSVVFLPSGWMDGRAGAVGWQHREQAGHSVSLLVSPGLLQQTNTHMLSSTLLRHNPINLNGITHGLKFLQDQQWGLLLQLLGAVQLMV